MISSYGIRHNSVCFFGVQLLFLLCLLPLHCFFPTKAPFTHDLCWKPQHRCNMLQLGYKTPMSVCLSTGRLTDCQAGWLEGTNRMNKWEACAKEYDAVGLNKKFEFAPSMQDFLQNHTICSTGNCVLWQSFATQLHFANPVAVADFTIKAADDSCRYPGSH